jgi:hypothetical protein
MLFFISAYSYYGTEAANTHPYVPAFLEFGGYSLALALAAYIVAVMWTR